MRRILAWGAFALPLTLAAASTNNPYGACAHVTRSEPAARTCALMRQAGIGWVLYVNTEGVKSVMDDDLLYDRGLMVTDAYTVADGNPRYTAQNGLLFSLDGTQLLGVPTNRTELEVPNGVTKVVLPYQNHLQTLTLQADSVDALPTVNYARLSRTGTILVKDDLLDDYLSAERETLQSTQLHAAAQGNPDSRYTVKDDLAVSDDGMVHLALSDAMRWASLPDYVTGLESGALQGVPEIAALLLPQDGEPITFEDGCFDGADNLTTIGCYSQQQVEAARAAAPAGVTVTLLQADASGAPIRARQSDRSFRRCVLPKRK